MTHYLLDANVLVRFLVQDDHRQSPAATTLFERAEQQEIHLHLDVLAITEVVYVLIGRYGRSRIEVVNALLSIIQNIGVETMDRDMVTDALKRFGAKNVDFADVWLATRSAKLSLPVASFDRDLDKFKDIERFEPV